MEPTKTEVRLSDALANAVVPVQGKRPVLLNRLIRLGLELLGRDNVGDDEVSAVREAIGHRVTEQLGELTQAVERADAAKAEVKRLEREAARLRAANKANSQDGYLITQAQADKFKTLCTYGLSHEAAAEQLNIPVTAVKALVAGRTMVLIRPPHPGGRPSGKRALDL